jgi:hypothetical protein
MLQLYLKCYRVLYLAGGLNFFLEIITFCRELIKVAPTNLLPDCYVYPAESMIALLKLDEAERFLHEGLVAFQDDGLLTSKVSCLIGLPSPMAALAVARRFMDQSS